MHRAEKSSSKICRSREVERAQELHRRKISGVKSYLTGIISKPPAARPPNSFRRNQTSVCGTVGGSSSTTTLDTVGDKVDGEDFQNGNVEPSTEDPTGSAQSFGSYQDDDDFEGAPESIKEDPSMWFGGDDHNASICKADEFRSVAPASIKKGALSPSFPVGPPPAKKSLNRAFRVRKLREIEASNVGLFDRIKKSASHYRNDDLRREWRQNVSYLSSICEFPLARDIIASPTHSQHNSAAASLFRDSEDDDEDLSFLAGKHASITAATTKAASTRGGGGGGASLPSIQPSPSAIHPIKAIPTSPKKTALNLVPAFRSLRRSMPQQPGLPPISSPSRGGSIGSGECSLQQSSSGLANNSNLDNLVSPPRKTIARLSLHSSRSDVQHNPENLSSPRRAPSIMRQASASGNESATFIGDLQAQEGQPEAPGDLKYQLLKTGRFVGGTYLVLTVFCGDGVRNPYGFDVFAFHRESKCEYTLSVTREMAHELIETSSSRSLAEETEAAAGTNWSMQQIARSICDHVQFAVLESGRGEILFLMPTSDKHTSTIGDTSGDNNNRSNGSLLVDVSSHLLSLCVHQIIELESSEFNSFSESDEDQDELDKHSPQSRGATYPTRGSKEQQQRHRNKKRRLHVLASTCMTAAATTSPGLMFRPHETTSETSRAAISFCVFDQLPPVRATVSQSLKSSSSLMTEVIIDELYVVLGGDRDVRHRRISIERMVITAMSHLHIISVPSGGINGDSEQFKEALILNARVNPQLRFCEGMSISVPVTTSTLQRKRSRQQLLTTPTPFFLEPSHPTVLLQTGLVWREAYLLAQVTISIPVSQSHTLYQPWRWKDHQIQDIHENIAIRVFNPTSGLFSERVLTSEFVAAILNVASHESSHSIAASMDTLTFSKFLLSRLHLDADLFGAQVIAFPELERSIVPYSSASGYRSPSGSPRAVAASTATACANAGSPGRKRPVRVVEEEHYPSEAAAAVVLQAHFRGFLIRKNVYQSRVGGPIESVDEAEEGEEDQEEEDDCNESTKVFARYEQVKGITMQNSAPIQQPVVEFTNEISVSAADSANDYETDTAFSDNDGVAETATDNSKIRTSRNEGNQTKVSAVRKGVKKNGRYFLELLSEERPPVAMRIGPLGTLYIGV